MQSPSAESVLIGFGLISGFIIMFVVLVPIPNLFEINTNNNMTQIEIAKNQLIYGGYQGIAIASLIGLLVGSVFTYISVKKTTKHDHTLYVLIKEGIIRIHENKNDGIKNKEIAKIMQSMILALTNKRDLEKKLLKLCNDILIDEHYTKNKDAINNITPLINKLNQRIDGEIEFLGNWLGTKQTDTSKEQNNNQK